MSFVKLFPTYKEAAESAKTIAMAQNVIVHMRAVESNWGISTSYAALLNYHEVEPEYSPSEKDYVYEDPDDTGHEILKEINDDMDSYGRSEEDGWYYD